MKLAEEAKAVEVSEAPIVIKAMENLEKAITYQQGEIHELYRRLELVRTSLPQDDVEDAEKTITAKNVPLADELFAMLSNINRNTSTISHILRVLGI
jgi:hypothetical protein